jgi:predicted dehydrogenase
MRVAVAGLGWWGKHIVRSLRGSSKITVICGIDPIQSTETAAFATEFGLSLAVTLDEVLGRPDVEGVILATPHTLHEQQVLQVLGSGKQVFCEKPLTLTGASAERVVQASTQAKRILGIGHERRFETAIVELFRVVRSGSLGVLLHLEANLSHDLFRKFDKTNWRLSQKESPAGMMTGTGIHVTDVFVALAGPADTVSAVTDNMIFQPPALDYVTATIRFKNGARGTITFMSVTPYHGRIAVFGDKGWIELVFEGNVDDGARTILTMCAQTGAPRTHTIYEANNAVRENFEAWVDGVEGRAAYPFTAAELTGNIKLFEAIVRSAEMDGARVAIA